MKSKNTIFGSMESSLWSACYGLGGVVKVGVNSTAAVLGLVQCSFGAAEVVLGAAKIGVYGMNWSVASEESRKAIIPELESGQKFISQGFGHAYKGLENSVSSSKSALFSGIDAAKNFHDSLASGITALKLTCQSFDHAYKGENEIELVSIAPAAPAA